MSGWVDVVVQLRELSEGQVLQLEESLQTNSVFAVLSAGFSPSRDRVKVTLSETCKNIKVYHGWGIHPFAHIETQPEQWRREIESLQPHFIGEVGLDKRCLGTLDWDAQVDRARFGIELACEFGLPLLWHSVQATQRSMELISFASRQGVRGVWHNFHGSVETARQIVGLGWKLGVGPALLKEGAHRLRGTLKGLPVTSFMLESDWPQPRGSYQLDRVGESLARLVGFPVERLKIQLQENFFDLI